ncbi:MULTISPECIES: class II fructose-bisphosphate aldolase [unclassified Streptomyces]|uniref:class II fructose-bisphosphate aldolase n=1 Tax=unclassified Streptomyces TaxID=2593676 RepID=UPI002DDB4254|nr:class II fructose-bisphosphate aldolase [Streptomyces sp. NBC_01795]WSA92187.1 class II fructose-bisphosphate aldolase family protein [Streptomyces sp. NBC_01795]WSS44003.1 class II fructose-bisphosphate aldolase family protein [Streptomyces sp. NBC_01187]
MPLTPTPDLVAKGPIPAFNIIQLEHITAILGGAARAGRPVILQISENAVRYHGALAPLAAAALQAADRAAVPAAVHLDHATDPALVEEAVELGLQSVMFDASALEYEANVRATAEVVAACHARGVWVEAELGEVGGKDGVHAPGARTDPDEAAAYVAATGVDALAVAVGSSHAMRTRDAALDFALIRRLRAALDVPLVLHGSSGVSDEDLAEAVTAGMTKINMSTHLNIRFTRAVREALDARPDLVDPRKYLAPGREAVAEEVARLTALLSGAPAVDAPAVDAPAVEGEVTK